MAISRTRAARDVVAARLGLRRLQARARAEFRARIAAVETLLGGLAAGPVPVSAPMPADARAAVDRAVALMTRTGSADLGTRRPRPAPQTPAAVAVAPESLPESLPQAAPEHSAAPAPSDEHDEVWALVHRAQAGDGDAFGQLYDRYVDTVYRFVYHRVNDRALAEDFTSETFLRALRRIGTISYQGRDIGAWFVTIARNIVFDHTKSARNRLEIIAEQTPERAEHRPGPESAAIDGIIAEQLMAAVALLGGEQRECVLLRFIEGFSVSETATIMGKSDGAIKTLQHRAIRKLAALVDGQLR